LTPSPPLWRQLQAAAAILAAVRGGESATTALAKVEGPLRPGVQSLVFRVLRELGQAEALRKQLADRAPPPAADSLLCTALALTCNDHHAPYEAFTLVDQTVEAAKRNPATRMQASFINACLRRFLRERDELMASTSQDPVAQWNHPRWWINLLRQDHPCAWQAILRANNSQAPMTLRVNARKATQQAYLQTLTDAGIEAGPVGAQGVVLRKARPVHDIPGFSEGLVSVQDAAAQLAAQLLLGWPAQRPDVGAFVTRRRILDACAAPGGKTAHLLELADAEVVAMDIDSTRCERIHQNLDRLGLTAEVIVGDAAHPAVWWDGQQFDAILLDAPCTASGIVRRHPDVRWLRREADVQQLATIQARLLTSLWPLLRPGGRLLYCTCSVFRAEGDNQIQTFVAHNTDAVLRASPGHLMPQTGANEDAVPDNLAGDQDGFFYALLEKRAV